jgi:hypothetical protein
VEVVEYGSDVHSLVHLAPSRRNTMETLDEVVCWAETKSCIDRRRGHSCPHEACEENERAIAFLKRAREFRGADEKGKPVEGWLIPKK